MRSLLEWLLALGVLAGAVWLAAPVVLQWLPVTQAPVTLVESASPAMPTGVPNSAEGTAFVMLPDGAVVRVGADERSVRRILPERWQVGERVTEQGVYGERHIIGYRIDQSRFWITLERTAPNTERRVTAIYVQ